MTAILPFAVFLTCSLLALTTLAQGWRRYGAQWLSLHRELRSTAERVIPTGTATPTALRRSAVKGRARFRAGTLRQSPGMPLRVAA